MTTPTYRAFFEATGTIIYAGRPSGCLYGALPVGTWPLIGPDGGTFHRRDGGDPYERARFRVPGGQIVVVEREPAPEQLDAALAGRGGSL